MPRVQHYKAEYPLTSNDTQICNYILHTYALMLLYIIVNTNTRGFLCHLHNTVVVLLFVISSIHRWHHITAAMLYQHTWMVNSFCFSKTQYHNYNKIILICETPTLFHTQNGFLDPLLCINTYSADFTPVKAKRLQK